MSCKRALMPILLMLGGCAADQVVSPAPPSPLASSPIAWHGTAPVTIEPAKVALRPRRSIGTYSRNIGCFVNVRPFFDTDFPSASNVTSAIHDGLTGAGVSVVVGADQSKTQSFVIRPTVSSAHVDLCNGAFLEDGPNDVDAEVDILWQVIKAQSGETVFETRTVGVGHSAETTMDLSPAVDRAVNDAAIHLLEIGPIQQYLGGGGLEPLAVTAKAPLETPAADGILMPMTLSQTSSIESTTSKPETSVFTVGAEGRHGYAVAISEAGYVLTFASMLDHAATVMLTQPGTNPLEATLLRVDEHTGMALLKIDAAPGHGLTIRIRHVTSGETIYALNNASTNAGKVLGTADSSGSMPTTLSGVSSGAPILDSAGALVGIAEPATDGSIRMIPISLAFRGLHVGLAFSEE